ncbi:probable WRKY transcription factor 14 isoform X2 [Lolium perenne]|uniref:probable WRKY transcription factor 14 isoform X2 n=1 Tax=Lolium perenne TaxID=4522 RepID=UPI0021EAD66F|nr:probable WRKY transcription factor 14 isoform X2 [Lolium perenne]
MDMEMQANAAATSGQEGDLADVVARANIAVASSSTSHHQPRPPPPPPPASAHKMVPYEEQQRRPMSVACGVGDAAMLEAVLLPTVVLDPYLLPPTGSYGLPQQQHHQQPLAFQISEHACCGASAGDVDAGEDAIKISPPSAHAHQMINRKNDVRKVVCIPAPPAMSNRAGGGGEVIPSDLWAWRKYGQKPIKGSPYPRGYYRCSSSKGCMARKQVERSRSDPNMLVITYTAEHNHPWPMHRNILAGYARGHSTDVTTSAAKKQKITSFTDNVASSSPSNHNNFLPEQNVMGCGNQTASNSMVVAVDGDGSTGIREGGGLMYELASNGVVQPDEVFAELEELEPDNSSLLVNVNVYSRGVSSNYEWHKL